MKLAALLVCLVAAAVVGLPIYGPYHQTAYTANSAGAGTAEFLKLGLWIGSIVALFTAAHFVLRKPPRSGPMTAEEQEEEHSRRQW